MERDSFLICKHGDMNTHKSSDTYYTVNKKAYDDWFNKKVTVIYVSWVARTFYPLRPGSKVQFRWFSELNEEVKAGLKSQNKKLFNKFEEAEPRDLPMKGEVANKFEQINPEDYYIAQWTINTYYLVKIADRDSEFPVTPASPWYEPNKLISMSKGGFIRFNKWKDLTSTMLSDLSSYNPELYQHFEQYYTKSEDQVVTVESNNTGYTYYKFKGDLYPANRVSEGYFAGELIPQEVRIFHSQYVKAASKVSPQTGSDFDIDKQYKTVVIDDMQYFNTQEAQKLGEYYHCKIEEELQKMYDAFKGPLDASDFMKLKDPYSQFKGKTLHELLDLKPTPIASWEARRRFIQPNSPNYSPNINQITNENLRTTNQCLSGGQKLTGNPIQSNRSKATITTGYFSNRKVISSSSAQIGVS